MAIKRLDYNVVNVQEKTIYQEKTKKQILIN